MDIVAAIFFVLCLERCGLSIEGKQKEKNRAPEKRDLIVNEKCIGENRNGTILQGYCRIAESRLVVERFRHDAYSQRLYFIHANVLSCFRYYHVYYGMESEYFCKT